MSIKTEKVPMTFPRSPLGRPQFRLWVTTGQFCQFETSIEQTCTLRTLMCEGAFNPRNIVESHCLVS